MTDRTAFLTVAALAAGVAVAAVAPGAWAADPPAYALAIRNHRFSPAQIEIPANTKVRLVIRNEDATPEEFDSTQLRRERVIPGGSEATLYVGPLPPGSYEFLGEFHPDTAQGRLIVR